jgi:HSP20 family molecular chaperone IbpA
MVTQQEQGERRSYVPNVDIIEENGDVEIHVDLPGAQPDSIEVQFEDGKLSIKAQVADRQPAGTKYLVREYGVGDFHRSFQVSDTIDGTRIEAAYKDGVLAVKMPKSEVARPRRIDVKSS